MPNPEFDNTGVNLDFIFRSIDNLVVSTDQTTGRENVSFSHLGSGFTANVVFWPIKGYPSKYKARMAARLEGRRISSEETIESEDPHARLEYAWGKMKYGFARLHVPD